MNLVILQTYNHGVTELITEAVGNFMEPFSYQTHFQKRLAKLV